MTEVAEIVNVGFSLHQQGNLDDAENAYIEALKLDDKNAEVYNLIGVLKLQKGEVESAVEYVEKALQISPEAYFYETLFQAYIRSENYSKIIAKEAVVMKLFPENFSLIFNIALAYKNLKQNKKAMLYYERALKINPSSYQAWFNLAHLYSIEGEYSNAVSAFKICTKLRKDDETEYFYSLALMQTKDYKNGLKHFEKRISKKTAIESQSKTYPGKIRNDNLWHGENIKDKTLLVYYEAGFGDVIMFSRYLPLAAKKCKKIILMCQKPLTQLFIENPQLGVSEIIDTFVPEKEVLFDYHIPLLSLPYALGLKEDDIFAYPDGYIRATQDKFEDAKKKYFENDNLKIGIKWKGNTYFDTDRVIPAEMFLPLIQTENTKFYSLQTFEGAEDVNKLQGIIDIGKDLIDFSQTAAVIANMDLIICNDTSLAHLAGAMGVPCWIILPYEVNWRWHNNLAKCDWYNSVKLYRQKSQGDWQGVFDEVEKDFIQAITKV